MVKVIPIKFHRFNEENGCLCVFESGQLVPFPIKRVFTVAAGKGDIRGQHAHKLCAQILVSISGSIRVKSDNGLEQSISLLEGMGSGLLIPPGIWSSQEYLCNDSVLMVLCDRGYEVDDYIRDYLEFKTFLSTKGSN
jgi:hypothetical protein